MTAWCMAHPWLTFILAILAICGLYDIGRGFADAAYEWSLREPEDK